MTRSNVGRNGGAVADISSEIECTSSIPLVHDSLLAYTNKFSLFYLYILIVTSSEDKYLFITF